jgi:uncharacterized damage-inducible protein DinB
MTTSLLDHAFGHHVWATITLIDSCSQLSSEQLDATAEGTYGSIIKTMRHLVGSDTSYLYSLTGRPGEYVDTDEMGLAEMRDVMQAEGRGWSEYLAGDPQPDAAVRHGFGGPEIEAPVGIRLAQALHHGTDHRSQICSALTILGQDPPAIDAWNYGERQGVVVTIPPAT